MLLRFPALLWFACFPQSSSLFFHDKGLDLLLTPNALALVPEINWPARRARGLRLRDRQHGRIRHSQPGGSGESGRRGLRHQLRRAPDPHQPARARRAASEGAADAGAVRPHPRRRRLERRHPDDHQVHYSLSS